MILEKLRTLDDKLGVGEPRRFYDTVLFIIIQSYLGHASAIVLTLVLTMEKKGNRDEYIFLLFIFDYFGCLLPLIFAPFVDNVRGHRLWNVCCLCVSSVLILVSFAVVTAMGLDIIISVAVFAGVATFSNVFIVGYEAQQLNDTIGTRTRFLAAVHFSVFYFVKGASQLALFWHPTSITTISKVLMALTPIMMLAFATYLYKAKHRFIVAQCNPGDNVLVLNCIFRVLKFAHHGIFFDRMLQYYSYAVVANAKKTCKLLFLSLSLSMIETLGSMMQLEWIHQYMLTKRTGLFQYTEFNALASFLTSFFILAVEFGLVPILRKLKQPFPIFSVLIIAGYAICTVGHACSLYIEYKAETIRQVRLEGEQTRIYLYNALDTYTHVWLGEDQATIPSGSMISLILSVPKGNRSLEISVMNPWYVAAYSIVFNDLEPLKTNAYVLTSNGAYRIPAEGFTRQSAAAPKTPAETTLTFICPKKIVNGTTNFNTWCAADVYVHSDHTPQTEKPFNMIDYGDASVIPVTPEKTFRVLVEYLNDFNYNPHPITFQPLQGGKYVFAMWPGDIQLVVKQRIIELLEPFPINAYAALPQIILWALGQALLRPSLNVVFIINNPAAVLATTWALRIACFKLWAPLIAVMKQLDYMDAKHQVTIFAIEVLLFVVLLVALRAARYHG